MIDGRAAIEMLLFIDEHHFHVYHTYTHPYVDTFTADNTRECGGGGGGGGVPDSTPPCPLIPGLLSLGYWFPHFVNTRGA
jgi:hypothetical protein|eukprot:COSAG02_NODE_13831_length_1342_cov_1.172164_2_plen_80_part_00